MNKEPSLPVPIYVGTSTLTCTYPPYVDWAALENTTDCSNTHRILAKHKSPRTPNFTGAGWDLAGRRHKVETLGDS